MIDYKLVFTLDVMMLIVKIDRFNKLIIYFLLHSNVKLKSYFNIQFIITCFIKYNTYLLTKNTNHLEKLFDEIVIACRKKIRYIFCTDKFFNSH